MIDAHLHIWQIGQHACCWPTSADTVIYRNFSIADWQAQALPLGVKGGVLVQTQPDDADTDFLLKEATHYSAIKAVIGWVELQSSFAYERIATLATHEKFRGIRPMLQQMECLDWLLDDQLSSCISLMVEKNLVFDALVRVDQLPQLALFIKKYPRLTVIINHAAKPCIADDSLLSFSAWCDAMRVFKDLPQVSCKLSGLVTEAGKTQNETILLPYMDFLLDNFGAERLLWGSDWPVMLSAPNSSMANYQAWIAIVKQFLAHLPVTDQQLILTDNACRVYQIVSQY